MLILYYLFRINWAIRNMNYTSINPYSKIKNYLIDSEFQKNRVVQKITTYMDYIPYINKLKMGYPDQITPGRPDYYITTTGTSGIPKIIPFHTNNQFSASSAVLIPFLRPKIMYSLLFGKICYFFRKEKEVQLKMTDKCIIFSNVVNMSKQISNKQLIFCFIKRYNINYNFINCLLNKFYKKNIFYISMQKDEQIDILHILNYKK